PGACPTAPPVTQSDPPASNASPAAGAVGRTNSSTCRGLRSRAVLHGRLAHVLLERTAERGFGRVADPLRCLTNARPSPKELGRTVNAPTRQVAKRRLADERREARCEPRPRETDALREVLHRPWASRIVVQLREGGTHVWIAHRSEPTADVRGLFLEPVADHV